MSWKWTRNSLSIFMVALIGGVYTETALAIDGPLVVANEYIADAELGFTIDQFDRLGVGIDVLGDINGDGIISQCYFR